MRRVRAWIKAAGLCLSAALAGCSDGSGPNGSARVSVHLTDAPGDVKAAVVTISEIYLQGGAEGKVVLLSEPVTVDLVTLANSTATLVDGFSIDAASYSELRFVITGGYIEVENAQGESEIYASSPTYAGLPDDAEVTGQLQMPSLGQSGLKVDFAAQGDLAIEADQDYLVDFDVAQSFGHAAGNSGMWVMHPVIKGATIGAAATVVATLGLGSGVALPDVGGNAVTLAEFSATLGGESLAFTDDDGDGVFEARFQFVVPGSYPFSIEGPAGLTITTNPAIPTEVEAEAGATATVALTIASAVAAP